MKIDFMEIILKYLDLFETQVHDFLLNHFYLDPFAWLVKLGRPRLCAIQMIQSAVI